MSDDRDRDSGTRVYVGNLTDKVKKEQLEEEFTRFGKLNSVWLAFNPPGFAFIEFENKDEAESACDSLNGTELLGSKLRVEISKGRRQSRGGGRFGDRGGRREGGGGRFNDRSGGFRGGRGGFRSGGDDRYGGSRSYERREFSSSSGGGGGGGGYRSGGSSGRYERSRSPQSRRY